MADIQQAISRVGSMDEKKDESALKIPHGTAGDESPTRIEEGGKEGLLLDEEQAFARVKANPDDATPIYLTWAHDDPTNPRNWLKWKKWYITCFASFLNFLTWVASNKAYFNMC